MISILGMIAAWSALAVAPTLNVQQGKRACHEVQLPVCWHTSGDNACFEPQSNFRASSNSPPEPPAFTTLSDFYQYRLAIEDPDVLLLIATSRKYIDRHSQFGAPVPGAGSVEQWAIRFHPNFEIRPATDSERRASLPGRSPPKTPEPAESKEKRIALDRALKRTAEASRAFPIQFEPDRQSSDGKYLAFLTDLEPAPLCEGLCLPLDWRLLLVGALRSNATHYWVDVFEVSTAERVIAIKGKSDLLRSEGLQWVDPHYFVVPLNDTLDRFEICDAGAASSKKRK